MIKKLVFILCVFLSSNAFAGAVLEGRITRLMLDKNHGPKIFIKMEGVHSGKIQCHTNQTWQFVMPISQEIDKTVYMSVLLAAHASGKKVRVDGNGLCNVFGAIETLRRIEILE